MHGSTDSEEEARASLLYSYKHTLNGFAAILSQEEATKLSGTCMYIKKKQCGEDFASHYYNYSTCFFPDNIFLSSTVVGL
jgi:hypothetical protein